MKDSVILGSGNSRYLKSVADFKTLYPTYDDFAAALVAGTLPIDLNGINAAGFQQVGDALNKYNLLKDATAALYGLPDTAVPDDVLALLNTLVSNAQSSADEKVKFQTGSYVGIGSAGTITITTGFKPKAAIICQSDYGIFAYGGQMGAHVKGVLFWVEGVSEALVDESYQLSPTAAFTQNEDGLNIVFNSGLNMNASSTTYNYIVFG